MEGENDARCEHRPESQHPVGRSALPLHQGVHLVWARSVVVVLFFEGPKVLGALRRRRFLVGPRWLLFGRFFEVSCAALGFVAFCIETWTLFVHVGKHVALKKKNPAAETHVAPRIAYTERNSFAGNGRGLARGPQGILGLFDL